MGMDKEILIVIGTVITVFLAMCLTISYVSTVNLECRQFGMQQGISASEIQAICK